MFSLYNEAPWPIFSQDEIQAVERVLRSGKVNYWTGEECRLFEEEFARYCGAPYSVAVANGTLALELAMKALSIGPGDEVIVSSRTFFASVSSIVRSGAIPVFADVDRTTQTISAETILPLITSRTRAIMAVHLAGWPCPMDELREIADCKGLFLIEDCAQAHGAAFGERKVGSFGDAAAFSFCQDKIMTTGGEGGMLLLRDGEHWRKAWSYKDHGKDIVLALEKEHSNGFRWLHTSIGSNFRMTEIQAAIGRKQIKKLDGWVEKRRRNAAVLTNILNGHRTIRVPIPEDDRVYHSYYKYYVFLRRENIDRSWGRDRIVMEINKAGVPCFSGSCPEVYLEKAIQERGLSPANRFPVARELGETSLMFLVHPTISRRMLENSAEKIIHVLDMAAR